MHNSNIKSFLDEKQVETLEAAAGLADDYALTHKVSFINYLVLISHLIPLNRKSLILCRYKGHG